MTTNLIVHGDCRNGRQAGEPFYGRKIDLLLTDPPYGVDVKMNSAESPEQKAVNERIDGDLTFEDAWDIFEGMMTVFGPLFAEHADAYIFTSWHVLGRWDGKLRDLMGVYGFRPMGIGVWDRGYPGKGDLAGAWGMGFDYIFYYKKGRRLLNGKRRNLLFDVDKELSGENIHPTQKPVALLEPMITASTDPGDFVLDPFGGSGAVSVAAQGCGRDSLAFETDERFIAPSRARLEQMGLGLEF